MPDKNSQSVKPIKKVKQISDETLRLLEAANDPKRQAEYEKSQEGLHDYTGLQNGDKYRTAAPIPERYQKIASQENWDPFAIEGDDAATLERSAALHQSTGDLGVNMIKNVGMYGGLIILVLIIIAVIFRTQKQKK